MAKRIDERKSQFKIVFCTARASSILANRRAKEYVAHWSVSLPCSTLCKIANIMPVKLC